MAPFELPGMPLWRGTARTPGNVQPLAFAMAWDPRGFIAQTTPPAIRAQILAGYAAEDYHFITPPPGTSAWADRRGDTNVAKIEAALGKVGPRILEIGGGSLYIAHALRRRHGATHYLLIDPALPAGVATGDDRIVAIKDYFPSNAVGAERFDTIVALHCLEHVDDPAAFLAGIAEALADATARAYLTFPDIGRQFANGDLNAVLHEHMSYLSRDMLDGLFGAAGLRILACRTVHDAFEVVAARGDRIVTAATDPGVLAAGAASFTALIDEGAARLRDLLARGPVTFHGATNGLNTFLHLARLDNAEGIRVIDGDAAKGGRYLPASSARIEGPSAAAYTGIVIVSAMTFWTDITAALARDFGVAPDRLRRLDPTLSAANAPTYSTTTNDGVGA